MTIKGREIGMSSQSVSQSASDKNVHSSYYRLGWSWTEEDASYTGWLAGWLAGWKNNAPHFQQLLQLLE
jgi:hypothetical protein